MVNSFRKVTNLLCLFPIKEKKKVFADWTALPTELLQLVANHLKPDMTDYIRFRSVCTSWRSSTTEPRLLDYPAQPPWLIFNINDTPEKLRFLLPSDGREHTITLPELHGKFAGLSYEGWLVVEDYDSLEIFLFNPITRKTLIHFPPLPNLPNIEDLNASMVNYVYSIATDSTPNSTCCTYVCSFQTTLAAFRAGDNSWTIMDTNNELVYHDAIYFKGKFFVVTSSSVVLVFNSNNLQRVATIPCPLYDVGSQRPQFFESSGKLALMHTELREFLGFRVLVIEGKPVRRFVRKKVKMWELDFEGPVRYKWRERRSIGEWMMFVGFSSVFLFPANRFPVGGQEDSVYWSGCLESRLEYYPNYKPGVYSFKNGKMKKLPWNIKKLNQFYNIVGSEWHKPCFQ